MFSLIILLLLKLLLRQTQLQHLNMDETVCYDSDEEEKWQWHYICWIYQQRNWQYCEQSSATCHCSAGAKSQGANSSGANKSEANPPWANSTGAQRKSHIKLITILWKLLKLTVTPIAMQILISLQTQKVTNIFPKCQHNVQHIQK